VGPVYSHFGIVNLALIIGEEFRDKANSRRGVVDED
jgi:hypothetical protein